VLCSAAAAVSAGDKIFDPTVLHETRVVMDPADWKALRDSYRENTYYAANVAIDGDIVEQVGVRSRGKGSRSPVKPGLKLDFNHYVKGQNFRGIKNIAAKNVIQDQSMVREYLANLVFQAMGIEVSGVSFTRVYVNDEYWGVYNLIEYGDVPFLKARFPNDSGGNLFKYEWLRVYNFGSRGADAAAYIPDPFKPESNENTLDGSVLAAFIQAINSGSDASFASDIAKYVDVQQFLTYIAIENALAESDGMLGTEGMNNFYMYQNAQNRFFFIPWDKNTSFNSPNWPLFRNVEANPLARRLLNDPAQKKIYVDQVKLAVANYVNPGFLQSKLEAAYTLIREAVIADTKKPYSNNDFELSISGLRGIIAARQADVAAQAP
jgi:spore coat protein CotH